MNDKPNKIIDQTTEIIAVICNLLFTFLYIQSSRWAFFFGIIGPILLGIVLWKKKLLAETALQVAYVSLAIWGFFQISPQWEKIEISASNHFLFILLGFVIVLISGRCLSQWTKADLPYLDSFTTIFALIATFLMMLPSHQAWLYWIIINATSVGLYFYKRMYFGTVMFFIYLCMSIDAYFQMGYFS